jgi:hypothetical protein
MSTAQQHRIGTRTSIASDTDYVALRQRESQFPWAYRSWVGSSKACDEPEDVPYGFTGKEGPCNLSPRDQAHTRKRNVRAEVWTPLHKPVVQRPGNQQGENLDASAAARIGQRIRGQLPPPVWETVRPGRNFTGIGPGDKTDSEIRNRIPPCVRRGTERLSTHVVGGPSASVVGTTQVIGMSSVERGRSRASLSERSLGFRPWVGVQEPPQGVAECLSFQRGGISTRQGYEELVRVG